MKLVPTQNEFQKAQDTVKQYEERQKQLTHVKRELGYKLRQFKSISFRVDKKRREITFAGYLEKSNKVKLAISRCNTTDKFEESIGKLIAVKKALGEDIENVVKLVEIGREQHQWEWLTKSMIIVPNKCN